MLHTSLHIVVVIITHHPAFPTDIVSLPDRPTDRCIECGFCESNCPSKDVTITPRQRISVFKELTRLQQLEAPTALEKTR